MQPKSLKLTKDTKAVIVVAVVVIAITFVIRYFGSSSFVPDEFKEARQEGSAISVELVNLLGESIKNLEIISQEDKNYKFSKALELVYKELERTQESKRKAIDLTRVLDKMAKAVSGITPIKARNLALEAVSDEIALISHLVIYNDAFNGLLETLRYKFSGDIRYDTKDVEILVRNMNQEAKEINNLNDLYNEKMKEFDRAIR